MLIARDAFRFSLHVSRSAETFHFAFHFGHLCAVVESFSRSSRRLIFRQRFAQGQTVKYGSRSERKVNGEARSVSKRI